jgi:chromosome segregation ATPase
MIDKRSAYDRCVADLEMARIVLHNMENGRNASEEELHRAKVHTKQLELKLAAAKLAQADYHLNSLRARLDYLEARCAREDVATKREQAELAWAREAVPVNTATVARLAAEFERHKRELEELSSEAELIESAA